MGRHRPKEPSLTKLQLMLAFSLVSTAPWTTLWSAPQLPPIVVDPSASILRKGTQHLEQAVYVSNSSLMYYSSRDPGHAHARHYRTGILHHDALAERQRQFAEGGRSHARDDELRQTATSTLMIL